MLRWITFRINIARKENATSLPLVQHFRFDVKSTWGDAAIVQEIIALGSNGVPVVQILRKGKRGGETEDTQTYISNPVAEQDYPLPPTSATAAAAIQYSAFLREFSNKWMYSYLLSLEQLKKEEIYWLQKNIRPLDRWINEIENKISQAIDHQKGPFETMSCLKVEEVIRVLEDQHIDLIEQRSDILLERNGSKTQMNIPDRQHERYIQHQLNWFIQTPPPMPPPHSVGPPPIETDVILGALAISSYYHRIPSPFMMFKNGSALEDGVQILYEDKRLFLPEKQQKIWDLIQYHCRGGGGKECLFLSLSSRDPPKALTVYQEWTTNTTQ